MNALIVDDCRLTRSVTADTLSRLGIRSEEARNGEEAWELLRTGGRFDLALIDWSMPFLSGIELVRKVRAVPDLKPLKLIMVTCHTEMDEIEAALRSGADEFIMKPASIDVIESKLRLLSLDLPGAAAGSEHA